MSATTKIVTECTRCRRQYEDGVRFCPIDGFAAVEVGDPFLGRLLMGQFQLLSACGRGVTGTVYRAQQTAMDRQVAVKVLRADLLPDPLIVKRFVREARAGARLCHPNIATVHLVGQTEEGLPYIVMEYVEGTPLSALVEAAGALPPVRLLHIGTQIASALAEAHDRGIIHRDLKPENILLTERRGESDIVKVVDFGIAKIVVDGVNSESQISRLGTIFGTPHYIAPEQASGGEVDHRADLYSLGCILFQMATGRVPFEGAAGIQVLLRHLREEPEDPRALSPWLPEPLARLILRLLAKDPQGRPASAEVLLGELRALKEGLAQVPPPSVVVDTAALGPVVTRRSSGKLPISPLASGEVPARPAVPAPVTLKVDEPDDGDLRALLPWWRRHGAAAGLLCAVLLGLGTGALFARGCNRSQATASTGSSPGNAVTATHQAPLPAGPGPTQARQGTQHAGKTAPMHHPAAHAKAAPAPQQAAAPPPAADDNLPETVFPAHGPPRYIPPQVPALTTTSPVLPPYPQRTDLPATSPPTAAAALPAPASPPPSAPAPPAQQQPAPATQPPPAPAPAAQAPQEEPVKAQPPQKDDEQEDTSSDPYERLK